MPTVSIKSLNKQFEVNKNEIIYDALERQGHELPHGCLAGSCGACRIEILEGAENLEPASSMEENTIGALKTNYERLHGRGSAANKIIRLACRAKLNGDGDLVIEPFKI